MLGVIASAAFAAEPARTVSAPSEGSRIVIETPAASTPAPVFFSASVDQTVRFGASEILGQWRLKVRVVQGRPELLTLGLAGEGEIMEVTGAGLRDWAVRQGAGATAGKRFLDLRPLLPAASPMTDAASKTFAVVPQEFEFVVRTRARVTALPPTTAVLLATPGEAVGFAAKVTLQADPAIDLRVTTVTGMTPLGDNALTHEAPQFFFTGEGRLDVRLAPRGGAAAEAELINVQLTGKANEAAGSVAFRLRGTLRAQKAGARLRLLAGRAALSDKATGDGWHTELVALERGQFAYELVSEREGALAVELTFAAAIRESGDWRTLEFAMPAGAVVPLQLDGLPAGVSFKPDASVVPTAVAASGGTPPATWRGFLPADGAVALAWKRAQETGEGALAFTSFEQTEVRIGAGRWRQSSQLSFRLLQGKLASVRCRLEGPGEILGVEGANVVGWKVLPGENENVRVLEVRLSRPMESQGTLTIQSQAELGAWPVRAEALRVTPEGGVRHSGFVRVANDGAVRLEVIEAAGMMQLAPGQFPGGASAPAGARQVFVYRFPSATYRYRVLATQIQPEVGVSAIATYELTETARAVAASVELDVREAPLREWTLRIPADYTVVALSGSDVADYVAESEATNGTRAVRVIFARAIEGRQLLELRLEKNQPAAAGEWALPALQFPGAKSVRGHVGAVATPGYRLVPARVERLVEVPLSFFPKQTAGLQQAWRLREPEWTAELRVEALGQSVQADVFHLYSLKEGAMATSVLLNYFVVGAPATEWRVAVPPGVGNLDVTGQNVRRDWRREGDQVIVALHQPVLGAATLLITFEQPMSARGGTIAPGEVRPLGVQSERGFIQVVSPWQVKHEIRRAEGGLLKLEPTELPAEFRLFTSAPSLAVYHYPARPFAFELAVEWYAPGETVEQVIDFAQLSSQVARDGQVVTEARFFVKTRGRQALRLALPAGVKLWETRVDNELVNARADGEQTLVPLPARLDPNEPAVVVLRFAQPANGNGTAVALAAPRAASAATVISEWTVRSDAGRRLVPRSGNIELTKPSLTETGFEWLSRRGGWRVIGLLLTTALAVLLLRGASRGALTAGVLTSALAVAVAAVLEASALHERRVNLRDLTFASTMVPVGEPLTVQMANLPVWRAMIVGWGIATAVAGVGALVAANASRRRGPFFSALVNIAGVSLLAIGLLAQHGGAILFFALFGAGVLWKLFLPSAGRWWRERYGVDDVPQPESGGGAATAVSLLLIAGLLLGTIAQVRAQPAKSGGAAPALVREAAASPAAIAEGTKPAQSLVQRWSIRGDRLFAEADLTVRGVAGESFLLLRAPAVLTDFKGEGLRVGKVEREGRAAYYVAAERDGVLTARVRFELPVPDRTQPLALPTGPAATQRIAIELDQGGWEIASASAVEIVPAVGGAENTSGATLVLAPDAAPAIRLQPTRRNVAAEATQFFTEAKNLFVPGPGVVNGFTRVNVRPVQGRVSALDLDVPPGFTVGEVNAGPVGAWRFDPQTRRLHVAVEPAQTTAFAFDVETQLGAGELPFALALAPLRIPGAAGDAGLIALAFGGDAQPEAVRTTELSPVNAQDFDATLLPRTREGQPLAALQNVWRYGPAGGRVELKIAPVAPEVRVTSRQVLSLDDDRMVMAVDLRVAIARVGLFKLSFVLPEGLEVEALSGAALSQWTEAQEGAQRIVTLHLNGRTLGEQAFSLTLAGAAPRAQDAWAFPRLLVREATRQTAEVLAVPGKGIRLRATERERVTQLDPRAFGGMQPGTLAFRLLQDDWVLRLGIETLEAWVTAQALQEVTVREGQTLTRLGLRYRVENAAVKHVQVRLPGLSEESARTVRATGAAVSDIVRTAGTPDTWEVRFQRGIAGETDVQIEFQGVARTSAGADTRETILPAEFVGARQTTLFVAVRSGGRLELEANALPRGWTRVDWSAVPAVLQNRGDRSVPAFCFRVAEAEGPLTVAVRRHEVAEALKLRVTQGDLTTLFAATGAFLTAVELKVEVLEKSTLRVRLPAGARLFNARVNGDAVPVVREGDAWLFYVAPSATGDRTAAVRLVYSAVASAKGGIALAGPSLSVPLENVTWRVAVPPGYTLEDYRGGLRLRETRTGGAFGVEDYRVLVNAKRSAETQQAMSLLQQAGALLQRGEQEKASEALSRLSNGQALDAASNEDARVQLRTLKTQQAVLGLNTRRQRLYLDNRADAARNDSLEHAANLNPFMQGKLNFDPRQVDQLLQGNTAEENTALRGIAARIVDQQLAAEPAPSAIDVTLPERGQVFTFARSLQVDGGAPLELKLDVKKIARPDFGFSALVLLAVAGIAALELMRRAPRPAN